MYPWDKLLRFNYTSELIYVLNILSWVSNFEGIPFFLQSLELLSFFIQARGGCGKVISSFIGLSKYIILYKLIHVRYILFYTIYNLEAFIRSSFKATLRL